MVVYRLGPIGHGFSLLRVTEDEVLCRMQADALKIYACDCTSHPINLWRPVSAVVTERKGSRHLCHLSHPSHQSHPSHASHPDRQRQLNHPCHSSHPSHASHLSHPSLPRFKRQYWTWPVIMVIAVLWLFLKTFWNMYFFEVKTSLFVWSWMDHLRYSY